MFEVRKRGRLRNNGIELRIERQAGRQAAREWKMKTRR